MNDNMGLQIKRDLRILSENFLELCCDLFGCSQPTLCPKSQYPPNNLYGGLLSVDLSSANVKGSMKKCQQNVMKTLGLNWETCVCLIGIISGGMFYFCMHVGTCVCVITYMWRSEGKSSFSCCTVWDQGLNSGHPAWWQVPPYTKLPPGPRLPCISVYVMGWGLEAKWEYLCFQGR